MRSGRTYDLAVIGGGVNGCGIARDAQGRGLSVFLGEMGDLAGATSSASTKLIHGGLRYLEFYEFRLVREALLEREVLLASAPHIIWPLRFVLPHHNGLRPWPVIRLGLFLYDHLGGRRILPPTQEPRPQAGRGRQAAQARIPPRLRIFRLLGRRCAAGRAQRPRRCRPRRRDRDAHPLRRRPPRRGRLALHARGPAEPRALRDHGARAGQRRRSVGVRSHPRCRRPQQPEPDAAGQGQPHRRRPALRSRPRLHLPERRRPHLLRHSLRAGLHPDRHHRRGLPRRSRHGRRSPTARPTTCSPR